MRMAGGFGGIGATRVGAHAERSPGAGGGGDLPAVVRTSGKVSRLVDQLPEVWALIRPRRGLLGLGLVLMAINRVSGLALPYSTKYLIDNVMIHRQMNP